MKSEPELMIEFMDNIRKQIDIARTLAHRRKDERWIAISAMHEKMLETVGKVAVTRTAN